jgi:flagellar biosynthesis chaperone FliJ
MGFEFSLETILRLRRGLERMERLKLETLAWEQARAKRELETISHEFFESRRRFQERIVRETFSSELQFEEFRAERVLATQLALKKRIVDLEQLRLAQILVFTKSRQRREILESLRDKKFAIYRQEMLRREQQGLDDLFVMRQNLLREE